MHVRFVSGVLPFLVVALGSAAFAQQPQTSPPVEGTASPVRGASPSGDQLPEAVANTLQEMTPAQRSMVEPVLRLQLPLQVGGQVSGSVAASFPGNPSLREIALPGAEVFVRGPTGANPVAPVQTTSRGHFRLGALAPGPYMTCATKDGFATSCVSVTVTDHNLSLTEPINIAPIAIAVRGCVTLKDGSPAERTALALPQTAGSAQVSAIDATGKVLTGPVTVNSAGCYVLPFAARDQNQNVTIKATYEQASASQPTYAGPLSSTTPVNLQLPNGPPVIDSFAATLGGQQVTRAPPGSTVTASVTAKSPDGFPLHYKWADSSGDLLPEDQSSVQWPLPRTNSLNVLFVEVSDGHGGVARGSLLVATGGSTQGATQPTAVPPVATPPKFAQPNALSPAFQHGSFNRFIDPALFMGCQGIDPLELSCIIEAFKYYQTIGVFDSNNHPTGSFANFGTWKAAWGFSDDPTKPGPNEIRAVYYNNGDLQFGRDMHCLRRDSAADPRDVFVGQLLINVCYVTNYSDGVSLVGGIPQVAIFNAAANVNPIATVAMVSITNQSPSTSIFGGSFWFAPLYKFGETSKLAAGPEGIAVGFVEKENIAIEPFLKSL
jgi:hypothetical protein